MKFIEKHFPENSSPINAVFHRPLSDLQKMAMQNENNSFSQSIKQIHNKCLCCEVNHEPKLYVVLQDAAFELTSEGIFRIRDKEIFENLHTVFKFITFKPNEAKLPPNNILRRIKQVHDKFSPSSNEYVGYEAGTISTSYLYTPTDLSRWNRDLDDRTISASSLHDIPPFIENVYPKFVELAKNDEAYSRWLYREALMSLVDQWEAGQVWSPSGHHDSNHQLIGAGPPPIPSAFVSDDAYLRHLNLWANGKHPYVRRFEPQLQGEQQNSDITMTYPFTQLTKNIQCPDEWERSQLKKLGIYFMVKESGCKFHPHYPEFVNASPPQLVKVTNLSSQGDFFRQLAQWFDDIRIDHILANKDIKVKDMPDHYDSVFEAEEATSVQTEAVIESDPVYENCLQEQLYDEIDETVFTIPQSDSETKNLKRMSQIHVTHFNFKESTPFSTPESSENVPEHPSDWGTDTNHDDPQPISTAINAGLPDWESGESPDMGKNDDSNYEMPLTVGDTVRAALSDADTSESSDSDDSSSDSDSDIDPGFNVSYVYYQKEGWKFCTCNSNEYNKPLTDFEEQQLEAIKKENVAIKQRRAVFLYGPKAKAHFNKYDLNPTIHPRYNQPKHFTDPPSEEWLHYPLSLNLRPRHVRRDCPHNPFNKSVLPKPSNEDDWYNSPPPEYPRGGAEEAEAALTRGEEYLKSIGMLYSKDDQTTSPPKNEHSKSAEVFDIPGPEAISEKISSSYPAYIFSEILTPSPVRHNGVDNKSKLHKIAHSIKLVHFDYDIHGYRLSECPDGRYVTFNFGNFSCNTIGCNCSLHGMTPYQAFAAYVPTNSKFPTTIQFHKSLDIAGTEV
jgi:hypothetical protein